MTFMDRDKQPVAWAPSPGSGRIAGSEKPPEATASKRPLPSWVRTSLESFWAARWRGVAAALGIAITWGLVAAWWTPRGPLTTSEALWSMTICLALGGLAGLIMRSRWAAVLAPVAFAVSFELARLDVSGPMVDGIETSFYGLIAFITGRGFHAVLSLVWLVLGAFLGAGLARYPRTSREDDRVESSRAGTIAGRVGAVAIALVFVATFAVIAQPASTDPIVDADGNEVVGSVAELTTVEANGHDLALMIRGHDTDNPVLLFLAGGPGGSEMGSMRNHLPGLEEHFTVATWDQRGAGKSYPELDPTDTVTLGGYIDDTFVVTDYLRDRFGQDRIYLLGQSWGTTLGVFAVQQRPELYRAFVGTGQMVSQLATDRIFYEDTLAWARENGDDALVADLESIGPPPYDQMLSYETSNSHEMSVYPYDHSMNSEGEAQMSENIIADEYTLIDEVHLLGAFVDTFAALYPQLQDIDFRETATEFEIPVFFVQGAHEAGGRADLFDQWYPMIEAPIKELSTFDTSGHRPLFEQPDEFVEFMVDTVLARTSPTV